MEEAKIRELKAFAVRIRMAAVEAIHAIGSGHIGGALSIADVLAVLYGGEMRIDPANPKWPERDKLVCSKGHAGPAVYGTLALKGYFPYEALKTLNRPGTNLPSHCDRNKTPGVDMTTGSLGQGTSLACGMALGDKLRGRDSRVFLIVGDGESNEGQVWEAIAFAAAKKLDNLVLLLDWNKRQLDGWTENVYPMGDYVANQVVKCMNKKGILVKDAKILILGITFKENCPDIRNTKVVDIYHTLSEYTHNIDVYDPWANTERVYHEYGISIKTQLPDEKYDAVILAVAHNEFLNLDFSAVRAANSVLYDVKGILPRDIIDARL